MFIKPFFTLRLKTKIGLICILLLTGACKTTNEVNSQSESSPNSMFTEAGKHIIPLSDRPRKKWDNAIIADLDQDGLQDMILIEHSWRVLIFWNEGGTFSEAQTLVNGDLHGVTVSDYDFDGKINLIVVQGGGGGSKPRNPLLYQVNKDRTITGGEQIPDLEKMRGRAAKFVDNDGNGVLDLLLTGFPTPEQLENGANHMHVHDGKGNFTFSEKLSRGDRLSYKTVVTDFNNDNLLDYIFYGGNNMVAVKGEKDASFTNVTNEVLGDSRKTKETTSITEIDFDNDGDFDLFLTRAQHYFKGEEFYDAENKRYAFFTRFKPYTSQPLKVKGDLIVKNLQMSYPNFDVFLGKEKRKKEFKKAANDYKNFKVSPKEAEGWPSEMDEKGIYIGYLGNEEWRIGGNVAAAATAGVILNVVETSKIEPLEDMPVVLLENQDGKFVDITTKMGISIPEQTTSATTGDFNNDGWADLFVLRFGNPASENKQILLLNKNGSGFERVVEHSIISKELGATGGHAQAFDYNQDGKVDIIHSNERGLWHMYTNSGENKNNFITVAVGASPNKKALPNNAQLTVRACGNTYKRVVGATSSPYSQGLDTNLHIGLGKCKKIDEAKVRWTNGEELIFEIHKVNSKTFVGAK